VETLEFLDGDGLPDLCTSAQSTRVVAGESLYDVAGEVGLDCEVLYNPRSSNFLRVGFSLFALFVAASICLNLWILLFLTRS
jgi:hypothetical protein